ncbi:hypothetical protein [Legionella antarctica]|uniref:hypothetical protein n=1 Tax=Legionella antarctica TaxID=2708020 RepID=UPI0015658C26|nr:hypothetical protein [Legionella antarctica]
MSSGSIRDTKSKPSTRSIRGVDKAIQIGRPAKGAKYRYFDLLGNSKKLVDEIAYRCVVIGGLTTIKIDKVDFSKNTGVKIGAIKTTINRLKDKGVIVSYEATKGRNSLWRFTLSQEIYDQYIDYFRGESGHM